MSNPWFEFEGDNWYTRNKECLGKAFDIPGFLLELYSIKPKKVLEIGASNGYRLAEIHKRYDCEVTAIEPSQKAVRQGQVKYPFVKFIRSTCEDCDLEEEFDLIIVNFVFHWINREDLYLCITKIDKMLDEGGWLIIGDFGTEYFFKREYHHLKNAGFYTWKMPYPELFIKSGRYLELAKLRFNHDTGKLSGSINIDDIGMVSLLRKQDMCVKQL